ncbi:MAG: GNAT family N-acetyltransferase, partial [Propionibacteriales bacterium]|nr:GNAT family N-acetyltransferase [Propionibacteriales bacterium]
MDAPYRYENLPLDTPDDDPRWAAYLDIFNAGFLDRRSGDKSVETFRRHRRADTAELGMITAEGPGLDGRQPVAAFASAPFTLNAGAGIVDCQVINTIAVRASHRRRGLLTAMMDEQLGAMRARGLGCATLSASEATIYGRYGFGVVNRLAEIAVDTKKFRLADHAPVVDGTVEFVDPDTLTDHFERINQAHQLRHRGAFGRQHGHFLTTTGAWDREDEGPSRGLRALVHFGTDGVPDGYAVFRHKGWDSKPITTQVAELCSADPTIDLALWQGLASIDLVERLTATVSVGDPLPYALADPWAVECTGVEDGAWLRILDLPTAVAERGFDTDGEVDLPRVLELDAEVRHLAGVLERVGDLGVGRSGGGDADHADPGDECGARRQAGGEALGHVFSNERDAVVSSSPRSAVHRNVPTGVERRNR